MQENEILETQLTPPSEGQLVEVRRRQWVVTAISGDNLTQTIDRKQHLVTLESLGEDSLGEELQVIWELEPGAKVLEKTSLPNITGYDKNEDLDAFLDAVRWGAATNADRGCLQSPFRSGITIEDFQLDPLVRAIDMARVNLLIADDVGLGKTIETGLVIQELMLRHRARTVFIVCPASLQIKWKTEMQEKFGLEFRIVDTEYLKLLRRKRGLQSNPWTSFPRLITSMDWIKSGEGERLLKDILPPEITYPRKFDILVIDEAHNIAPTANIVHSISSKRTQIIRRIAPHFTHHLFLTATPHNGFSESFTALLEMLDNQRFARTVEVDQAQLRQVMVRRMKSDIVDADGKPMFPKREIKTLEVEYTEEERKIHALLSEFKDLRNQSVAQSKLAFGTQFIMVLLKKRLFSSPAAFAKTLEKYVSSLSSGKKVRESKLTVKRLHDAIAKTSEDGIQEKEMEDAEDTVIESATREQIELTKRESEILNVLREWAERAKYGENSKAKAILNWLKNHLKNEDGSWNDRRVVLFTEYRDTQNWLANILMRNGYGGDQLQFIHGMNTEEEREKIKAAFQTSPKESKVRILLATDAASEGIDLQNYCNYMIHVEIPWNPNVLEQRNGRIDRHGQKREKVFIWHPVGKGYREDSASARNPGDIDGDADYLMRIVIKINEMRMDLGRVGDVITKHIMDTMQGKVTDTDFYLNRDRQKRRKHRVSQDMVLEKKLQERIKHLHDNLMGSKEDFHLSPDRIYGAVRTALKLAKKPALQTASLPNLQPGVNVYSVPNLDGSWSKALVGLKHPYTKVDRPITFDNAAMKDRDDLVLAHLNHPLVRLSLRLLREEIWRGDDVKTMNRVAVRSVEGLQDPVVVLYARLVVIGGDHHRLHEELTFSAGNLPSNLPGAPRYSRIEALYKIDELLKKSVPLDYVTPSALQELKNRFDRNTDSILRTIEARSRERLDQLNGTDENPGSIQRKRNKDREDIHNILENLAASIRKSLNEGDNPEEDVTEAEYVQQDLPGMNEEVKKERKIDREALNRRLEQIPAEEQQELEIIDRHYSNPQPRTFPVAVVFLVPRTKQWGSNL